MAKNLELKIQIDDLDFFKVELNKRNSIFSGTLKQIDTYYSFYKGLLKLRNQNGKYELIKYNRIEKGSERWSNYSLLFINGEEVENYFNDLFEIETVVEKVRQVYIYKNTRIHLDTVKKLGKFLELETVVNNITEDEAIEEFNEVVHFLKLDTNKEIRKSYRDLLLNL